MHNVPHTEESRAKMSLSHLGVPCPNRRRKTLTIDGVQLFHCRKCKEFLPRERFYTTKQSVDGLTYDCKKCHTQTSMESRDRDNARRINREYMRRVRKTNPEKIRVREMLASRARVKDEKYQARMILNSAVATGKVVKPTNCSECGKLRKLTAHHDDYSKPLDVRWLCYECHGKKNRRIEFERTERP